MGETFFGRLGKVTVARDCFGFNAARSAKSGENFDFTLRAALNLQTALKFYKR
jgi:hypothetical protein